MIIYKKILIILITLFPNSYLKFQALLLLAICGFYFYITYEKCPFSFKSTNFLENYSNFCAFLMVLVANLIITKTKDEWVMNLSILIIIFSLSFLIFWLLLTFDILFFKKMDFFKNKSAKFFFFYLAFHKSIKYTKKSWNILYYMKKLNFNYKFYRQNISVWNSSIQTLQKKQMKSRKLGKKGNILKSVFNIMNEIN